MLAIGLPVVPPPTLDLHAVDPSALLPSVQRQSWPSAAVACSRRREQRQPHRQPLRKQTRAAAACARHSICPRRCRLQTAAPTRAHDVRHRITVHRQKRDPRPKTATPVGSGGRGAKDATRRSGRQKTTMTTSSSTMTRLMRTRRRTLREQRAAMQTPTRPVSRPAAAIWTQNRTATRS